MKKAFLIITVLCTALMFSCKNNGYKIYNGLAQGTTYRIIAQNAPHDIEQQIAEYERGLVEHARLMAAEQDQEGDRREIDEKAGKRTCKMCEMRCCRGEYEE